MQAENEAMEQIESNTALQNGGKSHDNQNWRVGQFSGSTKGKASNMDNSSIGTETLDKLDVYFVVNHQPQDWAMKCGENIKQELQARNQLRIITE
jgi:hypothetical protein